MGDLLLPSRTWIPSVLLLSHPPQMANSHGPRGLFQLQPAGRGKKRKEKEHTFYGHIEIVWNILFLEVKVTAYTVFHWLILNDLITSSYKKGWEMLSIFLVAMCLAKTQGSRKREGKNI